VDDLQAMKSKDVGLIVRAISFQDFQPMWSWSSNVTDRQRDTRPVYVHFLIHAARVIVLSHWPHVWQLVAELVRQHVASVKVL